MIILYTSDGEILITPNCICSREAMLLTHFQYHLTCKAPQFYSKNLSFA